MERSLAEKKAKKYGTGAYVDYKKDRHCFVYDAKDRLREAHEKDGFGIWRDVSADHQAVDTVPDETSKPKPAAESK